MYIGIVQEFVQLIKRILPQGFISYGKSNNNSKSNFGWGGWADYGACDDSDVARRNRGATQHSQGLAMFNLARRDISYLPPPQHLDKNSLPKI
jgi:hypothetical protein